MTSTVTIRVAEDAYLGDAQFNLFVDGRQVGGAQTVTADYRLGQWQDFTFTCDCTPTDVAVSFINDAAGAGGDRNLFVGGVTVDGSLVGVQSATDAVVTKSLAGATVAALWSNGTLELPTGLTNGVLTVRVAEDAYHGDAQFKVLVDGRQVGGLFTTTADYHGGHWQDVTVATNLAGGAGAVSIVFVNDSSDAGGDRNLYVDSITLNGQVYQGETGAGANVVHCADGATGAALWSNGSVSIATPATGHLSLIGVAMSGDEETDAHDRAIGVSPILPTAAEIQHFAAAGLNVIRLPLLWERVQPVQGGPLDRTELALIDQTVKLAEQNGMKVILDIHNYASAYGASLGTAALPDSAFANLWGQIAQHYASDPNVLFGLMNEPHDITPAALVSAENAAIAAIRAAGAAQQTILVSGTDWDTADRWMTDGNATGIVGIKDPAHNYAIEVHEYFNGWNSGDVMHAASLDQGVADVSAITTWADQQGVKLFMGEIGVNTDQTSLRALDGMLSFMAQHSQTWLGATYWAAGAQSIYLPFSIEPTNGQDKPQLAILQDYVSQPASSATATLAAAAAPPPMTGTSGDDTLSGSAGADTILANQGGDLVHGGAGDDYLYGGKANDTVLGDSGSDTIQGNLGDDSLHGGQGSDCVFGGQGDDTIYGHLGDDTLSGDLGNDVLFGGAGADRFVFRPGGGTDWIGDFNYQEGDRIVLPTGTAYSVGEYQHQVIVTLASGDVIGLAGVAPSTVGADFVTFG